MAEGIDTAGPAWGDEDIGCWGPGVGSDLSVTVPSPTIFPASKSHIVWLSQVICFTGVEHPTAGSALTGLRTLPSSPECAHCCVDGS